jgi:hypothetical protein
MNPVATHIWDLLEVSLSLEHLCEKLMETYDVKADQCQSETLAYLNEMVKLGLIKETDN